ncbi:MAG: CcmD family protein [Bacteroidia bacterium]
MKKKFNLIMSQFSSSSSFPLASLNAKAFDNLKMKRLFSSIKVSHLASAILISICLTSQVCSAQNEAPQMADTFRSEGKIYVVVLVLSIVFACLATYLIIIDRKLKKLEDKVK